jgi:phage-related protein (TIGR01555 family)
MGWLDFIGGGSTALILPRDGATDAVNVTTMPSMNDVGTSRQPMYNTLTGQGTDRDPMASEQLRWYFEPVRREQIDTLFRTEGLARRVVELPPEYATQAGAESWSVRDKSNNSAPLEDVATELTLHQKMYEVDCAARKYGDAALFMMVEEGGVFDEKQQQDPLDLARVTKMRDLLVVEAHEMFVEEVQREAGADGGPTFGEPLIWRITPTRNGERLDLKVHASRLILFHGAHVGKAPTGRRIRRWGHDSVLEGTVGSLMSVMRARRGRDRFFEKFITWFATTVFPSAAVGLKDNAQDVYDKLKQRWSLLRFMTSMGVGLLNKDETIQQLNTPAGGIAELTRSALEDLAMTTGVPIGLWLGEIGGWSKGEGWEAAWRVKVASYQKNRYLGPLTRIYTVLFAARGEVPQFTIVFAPLESMGPLEVADERLKRYQSYTELVTMFGNAARRIIWRSVMAEGDRRDLQPAVEGEEPEWSTFAPEGGAMPLSVRREATPGSAMAEVAKSVYKGAADSAAPSVEAGVETQIQSLALNGAQVAALNADILESYRLGKMTEAGAVATIQMSYPATSEALILRVVQGQIKVGEQPETPAQDADDFSDKAMLAFEVSDEDVEIWRSLRDAAAEIVPLEGYAPGDPMLDQVHHTLLYFGAVSRSKKPDALRALIDAFATVSAPTPIPLGVRVFPAQEDGRSPVVLELLTKGFSGPYRKALVAMARFVSAEQYTKLRPHWTLGYARPTPEQVADLEAIPAPKSLHPLPELTLTWQGVAALHLPLE